MNPHLMLSALNRRLLNWVSPSFRAGQRFVRMVVIPTIAALLAACVVGALLAGSPQTYAQTVVEAAKRGTAPSAASQDVAREKHDAEDLASQVPERVIWNRVPVALSLQVGQERMVTFPTPVRLGLPPEVAPLLRAQLVDRTAYLFAAAPFAKTRIVAEDPVRGTVILLDVTASTSTSASPPVEIHSGSKGDSAAVYTVPQPESGDEEELPNEVDMVMLTRHAAQQIYAPRRLIKERPGVRQLAVDQNSAPGLYRGARLNAVPIGAWRSPTLYVTAVKLTNQGSEPIELDHRELRGNWIMATFQHGRVLRAGHEEDTTVVYLISDRRFEESR